MNFCVNFKLATWFLYFFFSPSLIPVVPIVPIRMWMTKEKLTLLNITVNAQQ